MSTKSDKFHPKKCAKDKFSIARKLNPIRTLTLKTCSYKLKSTEVEDELKYPNCNWDETKYKKTQN